MRFTYYILFCSFPFVAVSQQVIVNEINITGNKHTKDFVIKRELNFQVNDSIKLDNWQQLKIENRDNLLNTKLFNFVTISIDSTSKTNNAIKIIINVEERWYIWPYPIIEYADRNFSSFLHYKDYQMVNYGGFIEKENFRGRREVLKAKVRLGYREQYGFYYSKPFFKNNKNNGIGYFFAYNRQHESSYQTENNRLVYYKSNQFIRKNYETELYLYHRFDIYHHLNITFGFVNRKAGDSLILLNPDFYGNSQLTLSYFTFITSYIVDKRDLHYYPRSGYYFEISAMKYGLGILNELNKYWIYSAFSKYWKFSTRWSAGTSISAKKSSEKLPYLFNSGLGYNQLLNGFEYFVIQGSDFTMNKNMIRFTLLPEKTSHLSFVPFSKFNKIHYAAYLNAFFHTGYVRNNASIPSLNNTMENTCLYSYGLGFDIVTYYDKVFRIDFSANNFGNLGIYLHMSAPL